MKIRYLLTLLIATGSLLLFGPATIAQHSFGLKAGWTKATIRTIVRPQNFKSSAPDRTSFHFGVVFRSPLKEKLFIQPELLYLEKGYQRISKLTSGGYEASDFRFQSITAPILLGTGFGPIRIAAGPELEYTFKTSSKINEMDFQKSLVYDQRQWLINANLEAGIQLGHFQLSLRGSRGLTPFNKVQLVDVNGVPAERLLDYHFAWQWAITYYLAN